MYEKFLKDGFDLEIKEEKDRFVKTGNLINRQTKEKIPIINYIPRFSKENYCDNFSFQWQKFRNLQHDSRTGKQHSYNRLIDSSKWRLNDLAGKSILEVGCGPGRFTEIFLGCGAETVAFDMSEAVDINLQNSGLRKNLLLLQADIMNLSFFYEKFDYLFCYGVLQHTPAPEKTLKELVKFLKPGGKLTVDVYRKRFIPSCFSTPKYLWRPLTTRLKKETLLKVLYWYIPKYIRFDTLIRKIPRIGCILSGLIPIPCWNYLDKGYTKQQRINHAVMDTFDALSARYDKPQTKRKIEKWLVKMPDLGKTEVFYGGNGIVINSQKK